MVGPNELVEAFTAAVPFALREMAELEAVAREAPPVDTGTASVCAVIRLTTADGIWDMTMRFPETTATALARRVLTGMVEDVGAEMVRDCMGEVANVVAGQAKSLLVGTPSHFTLSPPSFRETPVTDGSVIWFHSDTGGFAVYLALHR